MQPISIAGRIQWFEFVICLLISAVPVAAVAIYFEFHPETGNSLIMVLAIFVGMVAGTVYVVSRKKEYVIDLSESMLKIRRNDSGKVIAEIDFTGEHRFAVAIRQGVVGRYGKTVRRWIQIFFSQKGTVIKLESGIIESQTLDGIIIPETIKKIRGIASPILKELADKKYSFNEPHLFALQNKPGNGVYGLSSFYALKDENSLRSIIRSAEKYHGKNVFLPILSDMYAKNISYNQFRKYFS